ncbi:MAG: branched-chain amino acid ABC transporter permease, partial [Deltaproteobacteria bacterium]
MVIRVNTIDNVVEWRWRNMLFVGVGSFFLSFVWRYMIRRKEMGGKAPAGEEIKNIPLGQRIFQEKKIYIPVLTGIGVFTMAFPFIFSIYQVNIMVTALTYVMLGLGLNIVVGLAGLLDLGY